MRTIIIIKPLKYVSYLFLVAMNFDASFLSKLGQLY